MMNCVNNYISLLTFLLSLYSVCCFECRYNDTDLAPLNRTWISKANCGTHGDVTYQINLCGPLKPSSGCPSGTSICMKFPNGTAISAGRFTHEELQLKGAENEALGEMWIPLSGGPCPEDPSKNLTTLVNLKCGPTMGSPKLLDFTYCVSYFEWESHVYCKGDKPEKEVPCYLYDDGCNRYDLSPLSKTKDGYLVSSEMDTDMYINVCRDINFVSSSINCPKGSGACRRSGSTWIGMGEPTEGLKRTNDNRLMLTYTSPAANSAVGCTSPPTTRIIFTCPKRGGGKDPRLVEDFDCQYEIEWETEYACREVTLTNTSCLLTQDKADIDIDLRPLTKTAPSKNPYKTTFTDSRNETYDFYLNVCGELKIACPTDDPAHKEKIPACQTKPSDSNFGMKMGSTEHTLLRYADRQLTLTYKGGALCHHNNFQRKTVIRFICDDNAVDAGRGQPKFEYEDDCTYVFNWTTKYACLDHPVEEACRLNVNGSRYDLSSLVRTSDNWRALHENNEQYGTGSYFINVCHNVMHTGEASKCDPNAAICYTVPGITTRNLGLYEHSPTYNSELEAIQITYTQGDSCGGTNQKTQSTITFKCKPGDLQSGPTLIYVSDDHCFYEFEWYTAAACRLGHYEGTDCKVYDETAGFSFDLSRLKKKLGQHYTVPGDGSHDFLLNVCGAVTETSCDSLNIVNPGICQVPSDGATGSSYVAGQVSTHLHYFDGMVNLTYSDGTPYHNDAKTPRKTEITFLCDPDAGVGNATYLSEVKLDHYYGFEWRTAYVCPNIPVECTVTDTAMGQEYDLSSLAMTSTEGNWEVSAGTGQAKYHINVCRSLNSVHVGSGCAASAAVCRTKMVNGTEVVDIANLGRVKSGLSVKREGWLRLVYESPTNSCKNETGAMVPYVTHLQFLCRIDAVVSTPSAPVQDSRCEYTIIWNTAAACPLVSKDNLTQQTCSIRDKNSDYVYNLLALRKHEDQPYTVTVKDKTYKLNICGNISTSLCDPLKGGNQAAVCSVSGGTKTGLAEGKYSLDYSEAGIMTLTYDGVRLDDGERVNVRIDFQCDRTVDLGEPRFVGHEEQTYIFEFRTSVACRPMGTDCLVQDDVGNQYNLGSLARDDGWAVLNPRSSSKYYINVCRPLNMLNTSCPAGPIGGCEVAADGKVYNMGYIQSKPIARSDHTVTIQYRNGDVCHKGSDFVCSGNGCAKGSKEPVMHSTRINFYCSSTEDGPVFEAELSTCVSIFNWRTPAACPLQSNSGANCKVTDPRYHYEFDLSRLRKTGSDYHVTQDDYEYLINVCGPLQEVGHCDLSTGAGACQTKPGNSAFTPVLAGKSNTNLTYIGGELTLTYTGGKDKCHGNYERKTLIKFTCDLTADETKGPTFIEESFNCQYVFEWPTKYACPPFKEGECSVTSPKGDKYDLSGLTLLSDNYEVVSTDKKRYVINVCRSLIHKSDATCPYNAASCLVDLTKPNTDPKRYQNIGEPTNHQVQYKDGKLLLVYENGDTCNDSSQRMTTHIALSCDKNAVDTSPAGHFMVGDCDHHFLWLTSRACPVSSVQPPDQSGTGQNLTCRVTNPATGYAFDLSSLRAKDGSTGWHVDDSDNHLLEFNVCGPLSGSKCQDEAPLMGACQSEKGGQKRTYNVGNVAGEPWFDDGIVVLNLTGGARCHGGRYQRNTILQFVCNNHHGMGRPVFVDETEDCTYYISWHTDLVCEDKVRCSVKTNDFHTIDLSSLSEGPDNIVHSSMNGSSFYLSVCTALTPKSGVLCPAGSAACQVSPTDGKTHVSLGKPKSAPTYDPATGFVTLVYVNGSTCDTDPKKNFTSKVIFSCKPGPLVFHPVFTGKAGCEFVFTWETAMVCYDKEPVTPTDKCGFTRAGTFYDLTELQASTPHKVQVDQSTFYINLCGSVTTPAACGTAMVCRDDGGNAVSFGEAHDFKVEEENSMMKMTYAHGGTCADGSTAISQILFICDPAAGLGEPEFETGVGCNVQFTWRTSKVCVQQEKSCSVISQGHLYDLTILSEETGAWNVTDTHGNTYWINVCSAIRDDTLRDCGENAAACRKNKDGQYDMIGSINGQKDMYRDGKDGSLILEYEQGNSACGRNRRRSDNVAARTRIRFMCANTFGGPVYVESDANTKQCLFEFLWKTKLACAVESVEVHPVNDVFIDPRSKGHLNLTSVLRKTYTVTETVSSTSHNSYTIQLDGKSATCGGGVICGISPDGTKRILGLLASEKFYIDDDILEARYSSSEKCGGKLSKMNVTSVVQFTCSKTSQPMKLLHHSTEDCVYMFSLETPQACLTAEVIVQPSNTNNGDSGAGDGTKSSSSSSGGGGVSGKTIGTIIAVFVSVITLCVLLIVFHKQERRVACFNIVRGLYSRRRGQYTQLPSEATDELQGEEEDILTFTDAASVETEAHRDEDPIVVVTQPGYHDDSDEDLLA